ncbi:hypothetical protein [Leuconostoc mesenteroides]|nr:hypothetical protein [Leuconostoc mesenteroides]
MRELGIKSRMQTHYHKPNTVATGDKKHTLFRPLHVLSGVSHTDLTYSQ